MNDDSKPTWGLLNSWHQRGGHNDFVLFARQSGVVSETAIWNVCTNQRCEKRGDNES